MRQASTADTRDDVGVYVGTTSGEIFYSVDDDGDSWQLLQSHLPAIFSLEAAVV